MAKLRYQSIPANVQRDIADMHLNGFSDDAIAFHIGTSEKEVKRILAEYGFRNYVWHKTKNEYAIIELLRDNGIYDVEQLKELL